MLVGIIITVESEQNSSYLQKILHITIKRKGDEMTCSFKRGSSHYAERQILALVKAAKRDRTFKTGDILGVFTRVTPSDNPRDLLKIWEKKKFS